MVLQQAKYFYLNFIDLQYATFILDFVKNLDLVFAMIISGPGFNLALLINHFLKELLCIV